MTGLAVDCRADNHSHLVMDVGTGVPNVSVTKSFTEPLQKSLVAASQTGIIATILVREGEFVSQGDVIAELDHDELDQTLRIARLRASTDAKLKSAQARFEIRKTQRDSILPMLDQGHANPAEVDEAMLQYNVAAAELETAREEYAEAQLSVDRILAQIKARKVLAPFDGVVTELHYRLGEMVSSSKPQVATLVQLEKLVARFYLSEQDVLSFSVGQNVSVRVRFGNQWIRPPAKIHFVSPVTDPDSGTARVDVLIDNPAGELRSGSICHWLGETAAHSTAGSLSDSIR